MKNKKIDYKSIHQRLKYLREFVNNLNQNVRGPSTIPETQWHRLNAETVLCERFAYYIDENFQAEIATAYKEIEEERKQRVIERKGKKILEPKREEESK